MLPQMHFLDLQHLYMFWTVGVTTAWCMHENTCTTHGTHMENASSTYGICLYHAWNTSVPSMEYVCTMHGYVSIMHATCMFHA